jgi:hypothetical protein
MNFTLITDFIAPEWLWGATLVALIAAAATRYSVTSRDRDWWEDQSEPTPPAIAMSQLISIIFLVLSLLQLHPERRRLSKVALHVRRGSSREALHPPNGTEYFVADYEIEERPHRAKLR